jgi:hypothetical protein
MRQMLSRFSLYVLLITLLGTFIWAQPGASKPDFSGTWDLNLAKSKLETPPPTSSTFYITHKEPFFGLKRTHVYSGKANKWGIELITDGPEVVQKEDDFHARLLWKQDALVLESYWIYKGTKTNNTVRYTLSSDGKVFTADENVAGPKAKHHNVWVFDRR